MVPVSAIFAGILALGYQFLAVLVIRQRRALGQGVGDGGSQPMLRRIRAHGNFGEYAPFTLLLMALNELNHAPRPLLVLAGAIFCLGRISHAYGLLVAEVKTLPSFAFRIGGMVATFITLTSLALLAFYTAL